MHAMIVGELGGLGKTKNCSVYWYTFGAKVLYLDLKYAVLLKPF
ncbi:hypothetical protein NO976_00410 [Planktothrix agardhii]|nr:hypothetical protein NO976_00410 [Planktothrix agardhii]